MDLIFDDWGDLGEIPEDIVLREDKEAIGRMIHTRISARCPVKTGRLRDSLIYRVLKRSVKWGSDVPYYRRHQWRFAHITAQDEKDIDERIEAAADRFFARIDAARKRRS